MKFYVDTSVWGGYEDKEFSEWTKPFFYQARQGKFILVLSDIKIEELNKAPDSIKELPTTIPPEYLETISITEEQLELSNRYINEGVLTKKFYTDAQHIAIATILKVDSLISWNFNHMVNFFRIRQYNYINLKFGYSIIDIRTPKEVIF
ncbi:MAG: PIN domain protein [Ignavibacteria bacterium]